MGKERQKKKGADDEWHSRSNEEKTADEANKWHTYNCNQDKGE